MYLKSHTVFLLFALIMLLPIDLSANPDETPWDTVMANIQVIESMSEPDSVKNTLMQKLFSKFQLTAEDYRRFYDDFSKRPPEKQATFLKQVEEIILERMNREYKKAR